MKRMRVALAALLVIFNLVLIYPYLWQDRPGWVESIEVSFIAMARFWATNFPHVFWNPVWYAGYPMRFSYVPIVPGGTALFGSLMGNFGRAYHLIAGISYALVPATLFLWMEVLTASVPASFLAALGFSIFPSIGRIFPEVVAAQGMLGSGMVVPWRMMVMVFYGEGPHTASMIFLPLAGLFFLNAVSTQKQRDMILAAFAIAGSALANPIGLWATGLLLLSILLVDFLYEGLRFETLKITGKVAVLSYLFSGFWYTPGFIRSDLFKEGGGTIATILAYFPWRPAGIALGFGLFLLGVKRWVKRKEAAVVVVWFVIVGMVVSAFYLFGIEFSPQARRFIPEWDMAAAAVVAFALTWGLRWVEGKSPHRRPAACPPMRREEAGTGKRGKKAAMVILILLLAAVAFPAAKSSWWFTKTTNAPMAGPRELSVNQWLAAHVGPTERVFLSANYSFWANTTSDAWQLKGGHWQASIQPLERMAGYQITNGEEGDISLLWLKIFGIRWILVNGKNSSVHYRDFAYPEKFTGLLDPGECVVCPGDVMERVPLKTGMATAVDPGHAYSLLLPMNGIDRKALTAYVSWLEEKPQTLVFDRIDNDHYRIRGKIGEGEAIRVAMSYDAGFRARDSSGAHVTVQRDPFGFLLLKPNRSGDIDIVLSYGPTPDFFLGWILFAGGIAWAVRLWRKEKI